MKQCFDVIVSLSFLMILCIPMLIISLLIKLTSKGPVLYWSDRVGRNNRIFQMPKFRTMRIDTPPVATHLLENPDEYLTPIGIVLRKFSLDEFPQLWSVIKGDMSLVGPRAYYPDELRDQQKKYPKTQLAVKVVLSVKPGLTGYWQVSGRSEINFDKRIEMDATYVKKRSIIYDLWIILKTPSAMISGKGAL